MQVVARMVTRFAAVLILSGCAASTAPGLVGVTRSQLLMVPSAAINEQAALNFSRLTSDAGRAGKLNIDPVLTARVRGVAARLIRHVGTFRPDAANWRWEVSVLEQADKINAVCFPGGKIVVYSGIIRRLSLTDDELAAIIGHEIAHALREHSREKVSQSQLSSAIVNGIANSTSRTAIVNAQVAALGSHFFVQLPNSREMELEADLMGLELMARAGFDPRHASDVWRKMMETSDANSKSEFFNTHPNNERRMAALDSSVSKVLALYEGTTGNPGLAHTPDVTRPGADGEASAKPVLAAVALPAPATPVPKTSVGKIGQDSGQVERMAKQQGCNTDPLAVSTEKGPGFEKYTVACSDGHALVARCEFGNCQVLR